MRKLEDVLLFVEENREELLKIQNFQLMFPSIYEVNEIDDSIFNKYANQLKTFFDNNKRTLITTDWVLNRLIKDDKKENFFKFLNKKKKNIVVFISSGFDYVGSSVVENGFYKNIEEDEWKSDIKMFDRFKMIKEYTSVAFEPFKEPLIKKIDA